MIRNSNVNRVFNDLDAFRDFCREYGFVFNEANLYRRNSEAYYAFERKRKGEYTKDFKWDTDLGLTEQLHGTAH